MGIVDLSALQLLAGFKTGEITKTQAMEAYLDNQKDSLGAFITKLDRGTLLEQAQRPFDPQLKLDGLPMGIKDNIMVKGLLTTCGANMLGDFVPPYDATAYLWLKEQGALILGKTNMDGFAMGSSSETSAFGAVHNPWDETLVAGGSSGGSAAAVAAKMVAFALGTDTGGSARQPAAYCGVVAMKPTYGLVSRFGLNAFASSMDTIAPITRTVSDNEWVLKVMAGRDERDMTTIQAPDRPRKGLRVGFCQEDLQDVHREIREAVLEAVLVLGGMGAEMVPIQNAFSMDAMRIYAILTAVEAASNLARFDGSRYGTDRGSGFSPDVKRRILLGTHWAQMDLYETACHKRAEMIEKYHRLFQKVDVILSPVTAKMPFKLGEKSGDPIAMLSCDRFTAPANLTGGPALALPFKQAAVQLCGPHFSEKQLYLWGEALEKAGGGIGA